MKKLTFEQKALIIGTGNKIFPSLSISSKNSFFKTINFLKIFKSKKISKHLEYSAHNLGLFSLAMSSSIFHFLENLQEYKNVSKYEKMNNYQVQTFGKSQSYGKKYSSVSDSLRPSIRFGAYPFRNSIAFGLPWFY